MALSLFTVGQKLTAAGLNAIVNWANRQGSSTVQVTSPTSGVTVGANGKVTIPAGTASPIIIDGITGYENYSMLAKLTTSASTAPTMQMRTTAPATDATSNYDYQYSAGAVSTASAGSGTAGTLWPLSIANATRHVYDGTLIAPGLAEPTEFIFRSADRVVSTGAATISQIDAAHRSSTVFGGISITIPSGTVGGEVWVKGLAD